MDAGTMVQFVLTYTQVTTYYGSNNFQEQVFRHVVALKNWVVED